VLIYCMSRQGASCGYRKISINAYFGGNLVIGRLMAESRGNVWDWYREALGLRISSNGISLQMWEDEIRKIGH